MIRSVGLKHHVLRRPQKIPQNAFVLIRASSNVPTTQSSNELVSNESVYEKALSNPINFDTSSSIQGEESQILQVHLKPNQVLRAESGAMLFMTQGVEMSTGLGSKDGSSTTSAITDGFKRMLTGQNMFLSDYTFHGEPNTVGTLALGTDFPSKILRLPLSEYGEKIVAQKGAYLASSVDVDIQIEFTKKFTAGFFGGEGFILQSLTGNGDVFLKAGGTLVKKELSEGETLRISSGSLVAMTKDIAFDVTTMPGFKNVLFGGEGLFVTTLTGPGTVWLQGMPADRMISEIARRIPSGGIGIGVPIGMGSGSSDGGADSTGGETEGLSEEASLGGDNTEELVASSDAAIDADRNATVATSGIDMDSESPSALFGDAAPKDEGSLPKDDSDDTPGLHMEDTTSFSNQSDDFGEDVTQNQEFDDFVEDETSFTTMDDEKFGSEDGNIADEFSEAAEESTGSLGSILSSIWDMFRDDD